jgi:hypothetical protein
VTNFARRRNDDGSKFSPHHSLTALHLQLLALFSRAFHDARTAEHHERGAVGRDSHLVAGGAGEEWRKSVEAGRHVIEEHLTLELESADECREGWENVGWR